MQLFKKKLAKKKKKYKKMKKRKDDITDKIMKEEGHTGREKKINPLSAHIKV